MPDSTVRSAADDAWEDLLRQLPRQPRAQPRPFFYRRVRARLAANELAEPLRVPGWLRQPAYAVLLGALVLSLTGDCATASAAAGAAGVSYPAQH